MTSRRRPLTIERYYREVLAPQTPAFALALDDATGTNATDLAGLTTWAYDGSPALGSARPPLNRAGFDVLTFDGTNDRIIGPNSSAVGFGLTATLKAWIKITPGSGDIRIICRRILGTPGAYDFTWQNNGQLLGFWHNPTGQAFWAGIAGAAPAGQWNMVAMRRNGASVDLWCNGVTDGTAAAFNSDATAMNPNVVAIVGGNTWDGGSLMNGLMFAPVGCNSYLSNATLAAEYLQTINSLPR